MKTAPLLFTVFAFGVLTLAFADAPATGLRPRQNAATSTAAKKVPQPAWNTTAIAATENNRDVLPRTAMPSPRPIRNQSAAPMSIGGMAVSSARKPVAVINGTNIKRKP